MGLERRAYIPRHLAPPDAAVRVVGQAGSWWTMPAAEERPAEDDVPPPQDPGGGDDA